MNAFKRFSLLAFFLVSLATLAWVFHCCFTREKDHNNYRAFRIQQQEINSSPSKIISEHTYQTREGVRKDIWIVESNHQRLHYRIESKSSLLKLTPGEHQMELIEKLQGIQCWMQDKLLVANEQTEAPLQQIRYLEADHGLYHYKSQQFQADTVSLFFLRLPGHSLVFNTNPHDAFLRGIAQNVSFSISEGTPQFQAKNFKASMKGSEL